MSVCMTEEELAQHAIRFTRKARTQGEAAKMLGVHRSHYVNFIAGRKRPGPRILRKLGMQQVVHFLKAAPKKKRAPKADKPVKTAKVKAAKPRVKKAKVAAESASGTA